jgi:hypothetical protein
MQAGGRRRHVPNRDRSAEGLRDRVGVKLAGGARTAGRSEELFIDQRPTRVVVTPTQVPRHPPGQSDNVYRDKAGSLGRGGHDRAERIRQLLSGRVHPVWAAPGQFRTVP